jgi:hypothetical protein
MDVKTAFLNGELIEEVYVQQQEGFVTTGEERKVLRLRHALYGLRQAPRAWYEKLDGTLCKLGFTQSEHEHAIYCRGGGGRQLIVGVYVDDLLITGTTPEEIGRFKREMQLQFKIADLGLLSFYLSLEIQQGTGGIGLCQAHYAMKILQTARMGDCNSTPRVLFFLESSLVNWHSLKQRVVTMSSCEAENVAATSTATQRVWLAWLLADLKQEEAGPVELRMDNKSALALMKNHVFHERSKHIRVRYHYVRQCIEEGSLRADFISTKDQLANMGTKALGQVRFQELCARIGMVKIKSKLKYKV